MLTELLASVGEKLVSKISAFGDHHDFHKKKKTKSPASSFMFKPVSAREVELEMYWLYPIINLMVYTPAQLNS